MEIGYQFSCTFSQLCAFQRAILFLRITAPISDNFIMYSTKYKGDMNQNLWFGRSAKYPSWEFKTYSTQSNSYHIQLTFSTLAVGSCTVYAKAKNAVNLVPSDVIHRIYSRVFVHRTGANVISFKEHGFLCRCSQNPKILGSVMCQSLMLKFIQTEQ